MAWGVLHGGAERGAALSDRYVRRAPTPGRSRDWRLREKRSAHSSLLTSILKAR